MGPCDFGTTPDQREVLRIQFRSKTHKDIMLFIINKQFSNPQQTNTSKQLEINPRQPSNGPPLNINVRCTISCAESNRMLNNTRQNITYTFITQMNRVAESSMSEQRASLIVEAMPALQQRDEGTAQQLRARDESVAQQLRARDPPARGGNLPANAGATFLQYFSDEPVSLRTKNYLMFWGTRARQLENTPSYRQSQPQKGEADKVGVRSMAFLQHVQG